MWKNEKLMIWALAIQQSTLPNNNIIMINTVGCLKDWQRRDILLVEP